MFQEFSVKKVFISNSLLNNNIKIKNVNNSASINGVEFIIKRNSFYKENTEPRWFN